MRVFSAENSDLRYRVLRSAYASVIEVGSGVATKSTSVLADTNSSTASAIPAPVSIMTISAISSSSTSRMVRFTICSRVRLVNSWIPEPPEIKPIPSGPLMTMSARLFPRNIMSARLYSGRIPSMTSILAKPKSTSMISTRLPILASSIARFTEILDLPTPPFPLVTVMTRARFFCWLPPCFTSFLNCSAWSIYSLPPNSCFAMFCGSITLISSGTFCPKVA